MKIRTLELYTREAFSGLFKNRLMSLASLGAVVASLTILGFFVLFCFNLSYSAETIKNQSEMEAFLAEDLSEQQVAEIETRIKQIAQVKEYRLVSKEEAFQRMAESLGDRKDILAGLEGENPFPQSFIIKLHKPEDGGTVTEVLKQIAGIDDVQFPYDTVRIIVNIANIINIVTGSIIAILILVSVFIISNTIKLTVFARRKEISIMKYIGATDSFIRWPFIIEGILIGTAGCIISFVILGYTYEYFSRFFVNGPVILKLIPFNDIARQILISFFLIGAGIGAAGSAISIRKYLYV